ncbi:hypothetical protein VP1G_10944 [Cytospora mali]|uniref:Uncharacterized protein n=1 Tax=Cytospora mali TaxID=578113 RepID=A0A194V132_CYTMA|nr:hypothetical protein VP1G_10944 [Valsa mali var. pyri (nom. inval.)]
MRVRERPVEPRPVIRRQGQPLPQPLHQVRVADEIPTEQHGIVLARLQDAPRIRVVPPTASEEGRVPKDLPELAQVHIGQAPRPEERLLLGLAEDLLVPRLDEADVAQQRQLPLELPAQVAPGLEALLAARLVEQAEGREPDGQAVLADLGGQRVHELEHEGAPPLRAAAVGVRPLVDVGREELLREVPVAGVQLHAVEARANTSLGSSHGVADGQSVGVPVSWGRLARPECHSCA